MKEVKISINLYSYDELEGKAKKRALNEHWEFIDSLEEEYENENGELIKEYRAHEIEEVEDSLRANEYLFFEDGELSQTITYTGKHEKAGITEFIFKGKTYTI